MTVEIEDGGGDGSDLLEAGRPGSEIAGKKHEPAFSWRELRIPIFVGAVAALVAAAYWFLLEAGWWVFWGHTAPDVGATHLGAHLWALPLALAAVGVAIGRCRRIFGDPGEIDLVVDNIHVYRGLGHRQNKAMLPISLLTVTSGGSVGPEAPLVQFTGTTGYALAEWAGLDERERRIAMLSGMAVGFTALFGHPLAAMIFALEIPHRRSLQYIEALLPAALASAIGFVIFTALTGHGFDTAWLFPAPGDVTWWQLPLAIGLGCLAALVGRLYAELQKVSRALFRLVPSLELRGALVGALIGVVGWLYPDTLFFGEAQLTSVMREPVVWQALLLMAALKLCTVSLSLSGGWRGGLIIPMFLVGAMLGRVLHVHFPFIPEPIACLCLMSALNTAVTKTPLGSTLVVALMSGVSTVAPIFLASLAAFFLSERVAIIHSQRDAEPAFPATASPQPAS
ncbi:MAG TPA: chloride channel protein [Planctomycetota bacterium]|nr:chloride channel protein [Planctomycetota bacterium]